MNDRDWDRLTDRLVAGDPLSEDDARQLAEARLDPQRASEMELLDGLAGFVDSGVEPSSESIAIARAALARVAAGETGPAFERRRARAFVTRRIVAGAVAAAAVAVLAWSWLGREPAPTATTVASVRLTIAAGEVTIDGRAIGDALPRIEASSTIAVRDGRACLAIEPRIDVCLDGTTSATIAGLADPETRVDVHRGHAVARLDPLPAGRSFALGAAELRARAVGTIFSIDVSDDGTSITAAVLEGVVEIQTGDATTRLVAHEVARLHDGVLQRERLSAEAEARDLQLLSSAPDLGGEIGYVAIEVSPPGATVLVDDRTLGRSPLVAALPVGEHRLELRGSDGARLGETLSVRAQMLVARRFALASSELPPVVPDVPTAEPAAVDETIDDDIVVGAPAHPRAVVRSPRELLAEARTLRREDRWSDAAGIYRRLLRDHPRSSEAHTALVSLGDLLLDRLGKPEQAASAYLRYVREGGGALAPEARWGIIRARRKKGDAKGERDAIADFLRHHPDDARAASLR